MCDPERASETGRAIGEWRFKPGCQVLVRTGRLEGLVEKEKLFSISTWRSFSRVAFGDSVGAPQRGIGRWQCAGELQLNWYSRR